MLASDIAGMPSSEKSRTPLVLRLPDGDWSTAILQILLGYQSNFHNE
jgi:hypothetical protein